MNAVSQGSAVLRLKLALLCFQRRAEARLANRLLNCVGVEVAFHTNNATREVGRYSSFGCDFLSSRRDRTDTVRAGHIAYFKLKHCRSLFVIEHDVMINLPSMTRSIPGSYR